MRWPRRWWCASRPTCARAWTATRSTSAWTPPTGRRGDIGPVFPRLRVEHAQRRGAVRLRDPGRGRARLARLAAPGLAAVSIRPRRRWRRRARRWPSRSGRSRASRGRAAADAAAWTCEEGRRHVEEVVRRHAPRSRPAGRAPPAADAAAPTRRTRRGSRPRDPRAAHGRGAAPAAAGGHPDAQPAGDLREPGATGPEASPTPSR